MCLWQVHKEHKQVLVLWSTSDITPISGLFKGQSLGFLEGGSFTDFSLLLEVSDLDLESWNKNDMIYEDFSQFTKLELEYIL